MKIFKRTFFAGLVCVLGGILLLGGCQAVNSGADVFNFGKTDGNAVERPLIQTPSSGYLQVSQQVIPPAVSVYGAISDAAGLSGLLKKIPDRGNYEEVVILAATDYEGVKAGASGDAGAGAGAAVEQKFFSYGDLGILKGQPINLDTETVDNLGKSNLLFSLGAIKKGSFWDGKVLALLGENFAGAKILPVSINRKISREEAQKFAYILQTSLPERSLVVALADFGKPTYEYAADFENSFTNTVLSALDEDKMDELIGKDDAILQVEAGYLNSIKAVRAQSVLKSETGWQAIYGKGERLDNGKIYLVAFGDVMLGRYVRTLINSSGLDYPFIRADQNYLRVNDILLANLEGPIAKDAIKTSKSIAFRFMPDVAPLLKKYYFDVLSLANNHAYDMGQQGYDSSKELLDAQGILHFGDARGVDEDSAVKMIVRGQKIAFVGLEEVVYKINDEAAVKLVQTLVSEGYKVIPFVHMGIEYQHKPNARQKDFFHKLIDAGALMVIAHHPHVVEGFEKYNGKYIFYSLGNAVFDQYWSYDTQEGLSLAIVIGAGGDPKGGTYPEGGADVRVYPMPIKIERSQIRLMNKDERAVFFKKFAAWSGVENTEGVL